MFFVMELPTLNSFRDYTTFVCEMQVLISSDELAKDVAGAKALLERHQEHKVRSFSGYFIKKMLFYQPMFSK